MASVVIAGDVSGTCTLQAANAAGTTVLSLPTTSGTLVATGGSPTFTTINATNVIASANSNAATFNGTTGNITTVTAGLGNATAPAYSFTGDTNTGIFSPGADTIAFTEGGAEIARFDSSGNLGIGTATPASYGKLAVTGVSNFGVDQTDYIGIQGGGGTARIDAFGSNTNINTSLSTKGTGSFYIWRGGYGGTNTLLIDGSSNLQFNSGYGSVATAYGCRAWVNFNGTGTPAIRASGNVSSITDNGTGRYAINFTTAMPDANYGGNVSISSMPGVSDANIVTTDANDTVRANPTTTAFSFSTYSAQFNPLDMTFIRVSIFR